LRAGNSTLERFELKDGGLAAAASGGALCASSTSNAPRIALPCKRWSNLRQQRFERESGRL
jgi:hypothetical protein